MIGLLFVTFLRYRLMIVTEKLSVTDVHWILTNDIQTPLYKHIVERWRNLNEYEKEKRIIRKISVM